MVLICRNQTGVKKPIDFWLRKGRLAGSHSRPRTSRTMIDTGFLSSFSGQFNCPLLSHFLSRYSVGLVAQLRFIAYRCPFPVSRNMPRIVFFWTTLHLIYYTPPLDFHRFPKSSANVLSVETAIVEGQRYNKKWRFHEFLKLIVRSERDKTSCVWKCHKNKHNVL